MRAEGARRVGRGRRGAIMIGSAAAVIAAGVLAAAPAASAAPPRNRPAARSGSPWGPQTTDPDHNRDVDLHAECAPPAGPGRAACFAVRLTDLRDYYFGTAARAAVPAGLSPGNLLQAYRLTGSQGAGATVAIVDAYDDPKAESDLSHYRSTFGLPPCTSSNGCFRKINQDGGQTSFPRPDGGWAGEISLDLDMVSAICPLCRILLVESRDNALVDLGTAVNQAVSRGARYVSNSYGGSESSSETTLDSRYYNHPGAAITAATGDSAFRTEYPAASRYVIAVGGTSLRAGGSPRGWSETAWSRGGSGCSRYESKPPWQRDTGCGGRTMADIAAVADPMTGVAVYDTYQAGGWMIFGGTSVSSPIIAAVYARAGTPRSGDYPASYLYAHPSALFDITSGRNGSCRGSYLCTAMPGYDGPTGLGTPDGTAAFTR